MRSLKRTKKKSKEKIIKKKIATMHLHCCEGAESSKESRIQSRNSDPVQVSEEKCIHDEHKFNDEKERKKGRGGAKVFQLTEHAD